MWCVQTISPFHLTNEIHTKMPIEYSVLWKVRNWSESSVETEWAVWEGTMHLQFPTIWCKSSKKKSKMGTFVSEGFFYGELLRNSGLLSSKLPPLLSLTGQTQHWQGCSQNSPKNAIDKRGGQRQAKTTFFFFKKNKLGWVFLHTSHTKQLHKDVFNEERACQHPTGLSIAVVQTFS